MKIPIYVYSKLSETKTTHEIEEFAQEHGFEWVELHKTSFEEKALCSIKKSTKVKDCAVIYARFSSSNQNEISITGQLSECLAYCDRKQLAVSAIYADLATTGTNSRRVAFQTLHNDILDEKYNGYRYVVYSTNRFARNRKLCALRKSEYARLGIRVVYSSMDIADSPEGQMLEGTMEVMDQYFSQNLGQVVRRGMKERAKKCLYTGGAVPYGFRINDKKEYEIHPVAAEHIRLMFQMYNDKKGYTEILRTLNELGATSWSGHPLTKATLSEMISNPKYMGTYVFSRRSSADKSTGTRNNHSYKDESEMIIVPGGIPAIVDEKTFMDAQKRKEENKHGTHSRYEKETYLLTGLVYCAECGHAFTGNRRFAGRNKKKYVSYRCTNHNKGEKCSCKEVNRDYLEDFVLDIITEQVLQPSMTEALLNQFRTHQNDNNAEYHKTLTCLRAEVRDCESRINHLTDAVEQGIATNTLLYRIDSVEKEKQTLLMRIEEMENNTPKEIDEKEFAKLIKKTKQLIKTKKVDELRRFISYYVSRIEVGKDDITVVLSFDTIVSLVGGGEGNRTPVRKPLDTAFSECSPSFGIPLTHRRWTGYALR